MKRLAVISLWMVSFFPWQQSAKAALPVYWQQDVTYTIRVTLNTRHHTLQGRERLVYRNNSPDTLRFVWFHTYPNAYRDNSTVFAREMAKQGKSDFYFANKNQRGYMDWKRVTVDGRSAKTAYKKGDRTETKVFLPEPLFPGQSATFDIDFFVKLPFIFSRLGHIGHHYEITQWYPKIVVYDQKGWHPDGYHATGEFYGEFGSFDVWITLPRDLVVAATGNLVGPASEIAFRDSLVREGRKIAKMTNRQRKRYLKQRTKHIRKRQTQKTKTVHFHAEKVHDFAWFADAQFLIKTGKYKNTNIYAYVLPKHERAWKDAVRYVHDTLLYYGKWYGPYPYKQMSVVDGDLSAGGGMEYPNITVISSANLPFFRMLEMVIMHETGHQWFYGMLGSNEMDEAWMDEGINTFSEIRYLETKYGRAGNMVQWPRSLSFLPKIGDRWTAYASYMAYAYFNMDEPILQPAYKFRESYASMVYHKTAWMLFTLKHLVGDSTFNRIMQSYFRDWQYKHPHTEDFVAEVNRITGQDYSAYFDQWLKTTRKFDYTVGNVRQEKTADGYRVSVQVLRRAKGIVPVDVQVKTKNGQTLVKRCSGQKKEETLLFRTREKIKSVTVDPTRDLLEINHWNDRKPKKIRSVFLGDLPDFFHKQLFYGPSVWYNGQKDGIRLGLWARYGFPLFNNPTIQVGFSYGLSSGRVNHMVLLSQDLPFFHRRSQLSFLMKNVSGYKQRNVTLKFRVGPYLKRPPFHILSLEMAVNRVYDLAYVNHWDWSLGQNAMVTLNYTYRLKTIRWKNHYTLSLQKGFRTDFSKFEYAKISVEADQTFRWSKRFNTHVRFFGGAGSGTMPNQRRFFLAGDVDPDRRDFIALERKGTLAPLNRYTIYGQGNVRGYSVPFLKPGTPSPSGKWIAALNLDFPVPMTFFRLFYDVGNVWETQGEVALQTLRSDAGITLDFGLLKLDFPIWVSRPGDGKNLKFRWLFRASLGAISL